MAVLKTKMDSAQVNYERALEKGFSAQIAAAKELLEQARQEYEGSMTGRSSDEKDSKAQAASTIQ